MRFRNGVRRLVVFCLSVVLFFLVLLLPSCSFSEPQQYTKVIDGPFDTMTRLVIFSKKKADAEAFFTAFSDELSEWDKLADIYFEYDGVNNLRTLNLAAGGDPVELDPRLLDLLEYGLRAKEATGGRVDLLLGPVLSLWHDCRIAGNADPENARIPSDAELSAAAEIAAQSTVVIDRTAGTAYLPVPGSSVDVGAFAKGYATERICAEMEARGYTDFAANVGGNLRVSGDAAGDPWILSVRDPEGNGTVARTNQTGAVALATSGSYQRYFEVDGTRYHHIIDPETDLPAALGWTSVSVLCDDAGVADVLSTALFCLGREEGVSLLSTLSPSASVLWIAENGERYATGAFSEGGGS